MTEATEPFELLLSDVVLRLPLGKVLFCATRGYGR